MRWLTFSSSFPKALLVKAGELMLGRRRLSREIALRVLFQVEPGGDLTPSESFSLFCDNFGPRENGEEALDYSDKAFREAVPFARELFFGVTSHKEELDKVLTDASENWRVDRMSKVDRNVLRLALFEMLYLDDIPPKVSLNEAIDLGKDYGSEDSGAFINGVLDGIHRRMFQDKISVNQYPCPEKAE